MYQEERLYQILEALREKGFLRKQEIMAMFGISRDTARRDIVALTSRGLALRTYGGISIPQEKPPARFVDRHGEEAQVKDKLGRLATAYIRKDSRIFLDTSTTVESICQHLKEKSCVYTNSIDIIDKLQFHSEIEAHLLGGRLNSNYRYLYGEETVDALKRMKFDICFLGACSITDQGVYTYEKEDAEVKHLVAKQSSLVCVLVANKKFLNQPNVKFCGLDEVDIILTSSIPPKNILKALAAANCSIVWDIHREK